MCPKPNDTGSSLSATSHVGELTDTSMPTLFNVLTQQEDPRDTWVSYTYPIDLNINHFNPKQTIKLHIRKFFFIFNIKVNSTYLKGANS